MVPLVQAINKQTQRVIEQNKYQGQFLHDASHQLRTPLSILKTQVSYALRETDPQESRQALLAMNHIIQRATRLTNQLLQLARAQHTADALRDFEKEPIYLITTVQQCIDWLELPALNKNIDMVFRHHLPTETPHLNGFPLLLQEALMNILDNALQYSPRNSHIYINIHAHTPKDPTKVVFGAGGSVGSQDWMKAALTAQAADVNYKNMRFVAFEGGGEGLTALRGGHIQVFMGDAAEALSMIEGGSPVRVLAVYNSERLPGLLSDVPTAKEQGYDIEWPIIRGFYMGPKVDNASFEWWENAFNEAMDAEGYDAIRTQLGLFPFSITGEKLDSYIKERVAEYTKLADEFGLIKK